MQIIGDNYVKDEFRRHKTANTEQTIAFMEGWAVSTVVESLYPDGLVTIYEFC